MAELLKPEIIITGHINADYDALAAMVAAHKLYPEAVLIAPTMMERRGHHIFSDSIAYLFNFRQPKECDLSAVRLLVVVDTRKKSRIEHVHGVLDNPGLEIHVYDHHPDSDEDLPATVSMVKPWGATSSILIGLIREKELTLTVDEATMIGLGIYEDTGSFTFNSTTVNEFTAGAFLIEQGMDLDAVAEITSSDLTREQVHHLDALLRGSVTHYIHNIPIAISEVRFERFHGEFASVVHKFMDLEDHKVAFVLAFMDDRIHVIARSRLPEVDVSQVCKTLGGGGHDFASSATIKDRTMAEVKGAILAILLSIISPQMIVGKHMTSPAIVAEDAETMAKAEERMNRFGLKAIPIIAAGTRKAVGILEQQTAVRAVSHKLGDLPIADYMTRKIRTVAKTTDLYAAVEIILKERQRIVPVVEGEDIIGVLTRTDIIKLLIDESGRMAEKDPRGANVRERNIQDIIISQLPSELVKVLRAAGNLGDDLDMQVYAVGGFVRDLLMKRQNLDTDLSVEGDCIVFAEALALALDGHTRTHPKFRTARVFYKDSEGSERILDIATARLEYYEHPAALPTVERSSIKMDLYRRDFTVNALAVQLNKKQFGALIDPFGAQRDLSEKTIRVLHSLSFVEDPTRILRAVRFEKRFEFRICPQTEKLIKNALSLNMLEKLSGSRLFNELKNVFGEQNAPECLERLEGWDILRMVHPLLKLTPTKADLVERLNEILTWYTLLFHTPEPCPWVVYMLGLCQHGKYLEVKDMLGRLGLTERARADFMTLHKSIKNAVRGLTLIKKEREPQLSEIYNHLSAVEVEGLLYMIARYGQGHQIGHSVSTYLTRLRDQKVDITGDDLLKIGISSGPLFGEALKYALCAKLDGKAETKEEQLKAAALYIRIINEGEALAVQNVREVLGGRT